MDEVNANLLLNAIEILLTRGIPIYMEWANGDKLENPTIEDFEALKVKKMSEKE